MITAVKSFGSYVLSKPVVLSVGELIESSNDNKIKCDTNAVVECISCGVPNEWTELVFLSSKKYNHDTSIFQFQLPNGSTKLNLPIGGYLLALAPGCEIDGTDAIRPYTSISDENMSSSGTFEILCKRYDQWGLKESVETHFLFTRTDHSYRPPGAVSNYIHSLKPGQTMKFKYNSTCLGRINYPFPLHIQSVSMIAVGVGVAPMIQTLRALLRDTTEINYDDYRDGSTKMRIVLLYGVRTVRDILMRELLDEWQEKYRDIFKVVYCVGSRWANVHFGAKTVHKEKSQYKPPSLPEEYSTLTNAELGWVDGPKIQKHCSPPSESTRVIVCGLPGVYDKLCGPRLEKALAEKSVLAELGYTSQMVIKL